MRDEVSNVRLWQIRNTDKAILFSTMPPGESGGKQVWIAKSIMEHVSRDARLPNGWVPCTVTLPLWKAEDL
jgi:hypothetical protein